MLIILPLLCGVAGNASAQDQAQSILSPTEQLFESVIGSVCTIIAIDEDENVLRRGSGFILKGSRLLVTNAHVLAGFETAEVKCGEQTAPIERITNYDGEIDLVLARTGALNVEGLELSTRSEIRPGTQVYAFGSPYGLEGTISPGLTSYQRDILGQVYIQISTPISPGSSGGPITDASGTVLGVTVATLEVAQNINFALPVSAIQMLPRVDLRLSDLRSKQRRAPAADRVEPPVYPELPVAPAGAAFRGFPFGSSCGEIAVAEYERRLGPASRKGLTRFDERYAGMLEMPTSLLGIPVTVFYACHERFGMVRGYYEILGHRNSIGQIADEINTQFGAGIANPISEAEASESGCQWNFSLPGSRNYRPSERTTWRIDEQLRIDMIVCGGTSNMTFVIYGDPSLADLVDHVTEQKLIM